MKKFRFQVRTVDGINAMVYAEGQHLSDAITQLRTYRPNDVVIFFWKL